MFRKKENQQANEDFTLHFDGALSADNRWVIKAQMIPWSDIEGDCADLLPSDTENMAKPARLAFGTLMIEETPGLADEEMVEQIRGNPYLQFFLGYRKYTNQKPFAPSLMACFRQRFSLERLNVINETVCEQDKKDDDGPPATGKPVFACHRARRGLVY